MPQPLTDPERDEALGSLPDWRVRGDALTTSYAAGSARGALDLVARIGDLAEEADHHPDVDWRYDHVHVRTTTHSAGSRVTRKDVELARSISDAAAELGASAEPPD